MSYYLKHKEEHLGDHGSFGIQILLNFERELTRNERVAVIKANDLIHDAVMRENIASDPEQRTLANKEREDLLGLFKRYLSIFVEEIPNGYCTQWCCAHRPWFVVTTVRGRITIGRRKRVIRISWEPSVNGRADDLFASEDVTKGERMIHAWSLAKASEYIAMLMGVHA